MTEWISISVQEPPRDVYVAAIICKSVPVIAVYNGDWRQWFGGPPLVVTHWLPLPEHPDALRHAEEFRMMQTLRNSIESEK